MRRLYAAICGWLEADAEARLRDDPEYPEGSTSETERGTGYYTMPEMHGYRRGTEPEDDGGAYRLGFNTRHQGER